MNDDDDLDAELTEEPAPGSADEFLLRVARGSDQTTAQSEPTDPEDLAWATSRFEVRRHLGSGGFGAVYEVFDRKRNAVMALKRSTRRRDRGADERSRFKQEFRSLCDLDHPNLVRLYELHGEEAGWFFTMELVRGRDVRSYVLGADHEIDETRVRDVFRQLAEGLRFLHAAGRVHRDVKPTNVIVDDDGRVVLLDFGLAVDLVDATDRAVAGTPHYMAPEQSRHEPIGPAADWYAMGMMLHEVLVGRRMNPAELPEGEPKDLYRLCVELTNRVPELRPSGDEVLARLSRSPVIAASVERPMRAAFVGRDAELASLRRALDVTRSGRTAVALVHASSGMGKTALVDHFLQSLGTDVVVLGGRCFERESMPDKTLEGVIDALARHLSQLGAGEVAALVPDDVTALSRVFPTLGHVPAFRAAQGALGALVVEDKIEVRRRAVAAFVQLLARLAERCVLVLFIDDLQWGDAEGGALLAELLRSPNAPSMLVVGAYRSEELARSECLRALLPALQSSNDPNIDCRSIALDPLTDDESRALVESAMGDQASPSERSRCLEIARESRGSPFFLFELCRYTSEKRGDGSTGDLVLADMLTARIAALPFPARRLLDVIAIAGRPTDRGVVAKAAALADDEPLALELLRARSLVRGGTDDALETYHDRIRELVVSKVDERTRGLHHRALAETLVSRGGADPERLAGHYEGAGDAVTAARHWTEAADHAMEILGFERAAQLYRHAIGLVGDGDDGAQRRALHVKLGGALGHTAHGFEAATAYLTAAEGADEAQTFEMRRLAAEHYLTSGHLDEGFAVLETVLAATGLSIPKTRLSAFVQALALQASISMRGLEFRPDEREEVSPQLLSRIDAWSAASLAMMHADPARSLYYHMRALRLAIESGDSHRLLRELVHELMSRAFLRGEGPATSFESSVARRVETLLESIRDAGPRYSAAHGLVEASRGVRFAFGAQHRRSRAHLERAEAELSACPLQLGNDITRARVWLITTLFSLGEWKELARRQPFFLADARARGDRFAEEQLSLFDVFLELVADRPDAALSVHDRREHAWPKKHPRPGSVSFDPIVITTLYRDWGVGDAARRAMTTLWDDPARWLGARMSSTISILLFHHCGASHLASAGSARGTRRAYHLRVVEHFARALMRRPTPFSRATSTSLRAGVAACRGDVSEASMLVAEAEARFTLLDMAHYAAAARHRRGELVGGSAGRAFIDTAEASMRAQGVSNPARMSAALLPGRW